MQNNQTSPDDIKKTIISMMREYSKSRGLKSSDNKLDMIQAIDSDLDGIKSNDPEFYYDRKMELHQFEIDALREMINDQASKFTKESKEMENFRQGFLGNIIAVMGIFLAVFALIMGNIQIFQIISTTSLAKTILFLFCGELFLVICILGIIIGVGYLTNSTYIINNVGKFLRAITCLVFMFPLFFYAYRYRNALLNINPVVVVFICILCLFVILGLITYRSQNKK